MGFRDVESDDEDSLDEGSGLADGHTVQAYSDQAHLFRMVKANCGDGACLD